MGFRGVIFMANYVFNNADCSCLLCPTARGNLNIKFSNTVLFSRIKENAGFICVDVMPEMKGKCNSPANPAVAVAMATGGQLPDCIPLFSGKWVNTELCRTKFKDKETLLDAGILVCAYGGIVKITDAKNRKVINNHKASDFFLKNIHSEIAKLKNKNIMTSEGEAVIAKHLKILYDNKLAEIEKEKNDRALSDNKTNNISVDKKAERYFEPEYFSAKGKVCSGNCPSGFESTCPFAQTYPNNSVLLNNINKSSDLGDNIIKEKEKFPEDKETLEKAEKCQLDGNFECGVQYHHLISGNQCLNKYKSLVMLANFYNYDVNNSYNGICLPSLKIKDDNIKVSEKEKNIAKCEIMKQTGRQLHLGQHRYGGNFDIENSRAIMRNSGKGVEKYLYDNGKNQLLDYETMVNKDLFDLESFYKEELSSSCRLKGGEIQKKNEAQDFHKRMNGLSQMIKKSILAFPNQRTSGNRYYVSYISMLYDNSRTKNPEEINDILTGGHK